MNGYAFSLCGADLRALPSGALWWASESTLVVSDLHIGKARRAARFGGALLPPYEVAQTLTALDDAIALTRPATVICLGDSFDDRHAGEDLPEGAADWITRLMAGRRWIWVEGNHDPGPIDMGGEHIAGLALGPLTFRHIATEAAEGEVSGHYHPKTRLAGRSYRCFLLDQYRLILPAFGCYTGGLYADSPSLTRLFASGAVAITTGTPSRIVPLSRG